MISEFSSLHNHTHFSVMDGITLPEELVKTAKEKGLRSVAVTDHGVCHGHADIYLHGKKHGVRTIFGVEAYVIDSLEEWRKLKEAKDESDEDATNTGRFKEAGRRGHLVILACNREGLSNLYQLVYLAHKDGYYGKPRMDRAMLRSLSRGLVATSACMGGVIPVKVWQFQRGECKWEDVVAAARDYDSIFGRGRFFLELQLNESASQRVINEAMIRVHEETGIPLTVTVDSHYPGQDGWAAQEVLYMLRDKVSLSTRPADWNFEIRQLYLKSPAEMWESYERFGRSYIPEATIREAFANTILVDSLVEDYEPDTHTRLPAIKGVDDPFKSLGERAIAGLRARQLDKDERYVKQLIHELRVIKDKGFASYFLLVQTMIAEAKKEMLVGPGRGSGAGSLVCYTLGITDLDPLRHELMFERFLDPDRKELPDLDIDYEDPDRVKQIMAGIYGSDNVASLSTYGTFQIKGLMKDLARAYDLDHNEVNKLNKKIEQELKVLYAAQGELVKDKSMVTVTLDDVERVSPTFKEFCNKYPEPAKHFRALYGRNRHIGRHASAVIIGDNLPAETAIFKQRDKDSGELVTQTSFTEGIVNKNISAMGFVKFDMLGLATLRVIHHALELIAAKEGKTFQEELDRISGDRLDLDDKKVLEHVFHKGNFAGIFQFTGRGIRKVARSVKPDCFEDVVAIAALYRPGPLAAKVDKLYKDAKKKALSGQLKYEHPLLEKILKRTHGCLIYQEQLMLICRDLGMMQFKDVQRVRKTLLKKDKSKSDEFLLAETTELKGKFVEGCKKNGLTQERAEGWWKDILYFGGYGFNVAHAAAYSKVTMQTAWLATYYPLEFYSALLTKGQSAELQDDVSDIKKSGVKVLPVDVNESKLSHVARDGAIRLSFKTVKGVGPAAIEKIVKSQPYEDFFDFLRRSGASKTAIDPLIAVGAFDKLHKNMRMVEQWSAEYSSDGKYRGKKWPEFVEKCKEIKPEDYPLHDKVALENALMGFSVRGSPFEILDRKKKIEAVFGDTLLTYSEFIESTEELAMLPVVVKDFKERAQRNGKMFAFLKFGTDTGEEFEAPCFANIWQHIGARMRRGSVYIMTFNRKLDEPENLVVGRAGWNQSQHSASQSAINVDDIELNG